MGNVIPFKQLNKDDEIFDILKVNIITTYDNDFDQQIWDLDVRVLKKKYREDYVLVDELSDPCKFQGSYSPEKHVLGQVIKEITPKNRKPHLLKISLWYKNMGEVCPSVYENRDPKNEKDRLEVDKDLDELGYGFINRTQSKYYFQPDQRDVFETDIMSSFNSSSKVRNLFESFPSESEEDRCKREESIKEHRLDTIQWFYPEIRKMLSL